MDAQDIYPFEVIVSGTPLSLQAKSRVNLMAWKDEVRARALERRLELHDQAFLDEVPIAATILYFAAAPVDGDIDNIVKPILDALNAVAYLDDGQIECVKVQKLVRGEDWNVEVSSATLAEAVERSQAATPAVYIRIDADLKWRFVQ